MDALIPDTVQALVVAAVALLPGALYIWSFEQQAGRFGANVGDRVQRFLGASALFLVLELPLVYAVVRQLVHLGFRPLIDPLPGWSWLAILGYVVVPVVLGRLVGRAAARRSRWASWITGPAPSPRAWDELFARPGRTGWIRVQQSDGRWVCGLWGTSEATGLTSYASGYPEERDLLIAEIAEVDEHGEFLTDPDGAPVLTGRAAMVTWDGSTYSEFIPS